MSDIQSLIINRLRGALEQLQREGVGHIDIEDCAGFQYVIDGRPFVINVRELKQEES